MVVQQLIDAGAIPVGKTNLDQFATGLNGTRSPWGACGNSFNKDHVAYCQQQACYPLVVA